MLQQLEQCGVRKAFKVTEVNCTGFRAGENVCEDAKGKGTNSQRVSGSEIWEKGYFFWVRNGHKKAIAKPLFSYKNKKMNLGLAGRF